MSTVEDDLRFFESPFNNDLDTHSGRAFTVGVQNVAIGGQQNLRHNPHVVYHEDLRFDLTDISYTVPQLNVVEQTPPIQENINYIGISPTIRNNPLFVSFSGPVIWQLIGTIWYPVSDLVARAGQGTVYYRIPSMENLVIFAAAYPAVGAGAYTDFARIIYGYLPDELDKMVIR